MTMNWSRCLVGLTLAALLCGEAYAQQWTRFRGPNGTGVVSARDVPTSWSESDQNWKTELPGAGHSQPVIWEDRLFVTSAADEGRKRILLCLKTDTGKIDWSRSYDHATHGKHRLSSFANSTPAADAERVYAIMGSTDCTLRAFDHAGGEVWEASLGEFVGNHGQGSSPIVHDGMVIVAQEHEGTAFVAAYDTKTGDVRWKTPRKVSKAAYGTPCVYEPQGGPAQLVFLSEAHGISGVDARTGKPLWEAPVFDKRTTSSPVLSDGLAYGTCGSGGGGNYLVALRLGGRGDVSGTHVAYEIRTAAPYVPTPVIREGLLFLWNSSGIVTCADAKTGEAHWRERVGGQYFSSPVCVDDRLFSISDRGEVVVVSATKSFKLLARNPLGEDSHSTPTVAGGRMYVRTVSHVFSIGGKPATASAGD